MPTIKEIIEAMFNEIKAILKEYLNETETALKKRLKKLLITSIIVSVLTALVILFVGSASLFILIGSLKYLMTFMPAWKAWYITGISSGVIGALILLGLFLFIRKQSQIADPGLHDPLVNWWATLLMYLFSLLTITFSIRAYRETNLSRTHNPKSPLNS